MRPRGAEEYTVSPDYHIKILERLPLGATPVDVKTLSLSPPKQTIASVLSETRTVLLLESDGPNVRTKIRVAEDPVEIAGGGRDVAYVACRAAGCVDVINCAGLVKRIELPGLPQSLAWNGSYNARKQRIMVTCQAPDSDLGTVVVIAEETLEIVNTLKVGKQPRGISLDQQRKHMLVANYGSDSISIIDQAGKQTLATLPTAGRPWAINASWFDPEDIIISLWGGGILQRLDASQFPPVLSGLTALSTNDRTQSSMVPYACLPLDEDHLWIAPDSHSEAIALVRSDARDLRQVGYYRLGPEQQDEQGLGRVAISGHGLPCTLFIANRRRKEMLLAEMSRLKPTLSMNKALSREKR